MSWQAVSRVLEHSEATGAARFLLTILADASPNPDGSNAWPATDTLATRMRRTRRAVQYQLRRLEDEGHIVRTGRGPRGSIAYSIPCCAVASSRETKKSSAKKPSRRGESDHLVRMSERGWRDDGMAAFLGEDPGRRDEDLGRSGVKPIAPEPNDLSQNGGEEGEKSQVESPAEAGTTNAGGSDG
jgi:hypothetical protein